jgi:glycerol-3-phosphate acyltransferase PlsY
MVKGLLAVTVIARLLPFKTVEDRFLRELICGLVAILGHNFPVYLKFRGGKGVAASVGVFLGLAPKLLGAAFLLWGAIFLISGYVSLASVLAGLSLPIFSFWLAYPKVMHGFSLALGILILIRHRANLRRLLRGEEKKFFKKQG